MVVACFMLQVRSNAEAISILGLGSWRLKGRMDEAFAALAAQLEGTWRHQFDMELRLSPLPEVLYLLLGLPWSAVDTLCGRVFNVRISPVITWVMYWLRQHLQR